MTFPNKRSQNRLWLVHLPPPSVGGPTDPLDGWLKECRVCVCSSQPRSSGRSAGAHFSACLNYPHSNRSPSLVLGAEGELVKRRPSTNTQPAFRGLIFCFRVAFVGAAGSRAAQHPPVAVYLFISRPEQCTRGLGTRREDGDKGGLSGGAQQRLFSGQPVPANCWEQTLAQWESCVWRQNGGSLFTLYTTWDFGEKNQAKKRKPPPKKNSIRSRTQLLRFLVSLKEVKLPFKLEQRRKI